SVNPGGGTAAPSLKIKLPPSHTRPISPTSSGSIGAQTAAAKVCVLDIAGSPDSMIPSAQIGFRRRRQFPIDRTITCPMVSKENWNWGGGAVAVLLRLPLNAGLAT